MYAYIYMYVYIYIYIYVYIYVYIYTTGSTDDVQPAKEKTRSDEKVSRIVLYIG